MSKCPRCNRIMMVYTDWKPFDQVSGICYHCGFNYYTDHEILSTKDLLDERGMHPDDAYPELTAEELEECKKFDELWNIKKA
ncbi:MAG: hypothetical protein ACTSWQ_06640 [Candidatus Thorarchaeota archaeon]